MQSSSDSRQISTRSRTRSPPRRFSLNKIVYYDVGYFNRGFVKVISVSIDLIEGKLLLNLLRC